MKVPREIQSALDACGLPWSFEMGSRHIKIIVGGRFAGIIPKCGSPSESNRRATLNIAAQIKRTAKELRQ